MSDNNTTVLSLEPGDSLSGRYRLEKVIGEGGMAAVWLATDLNLDRPVAIKVLPTALSRDTRSITRLKAEANRNLDLPHANIVRLYSFEQDPVRGNQAFLVMQYVEGRTLHELLAEHPDGLPKKQLQKWSAQIASAIDFAHKRGVLHRDIKPSNIIIEKATGDAYLMDFGIARETRDTMTMVTGRQESSGTLPYMSPQQLVGKNHKSNDIYSFAATLYEGFCGHPPFRTGDIAYQIREIDAEPIEALSKAANAALLAGLAKDSDMRPGTCMAMLRASSVKKPRVETNTSNAKAEKDSETAEGAEEVVLFDLLDQPLRGWLQSRNIKATNEGLQLDGELLPTGSFRIASRRDYSVMCGVRDLALAVVFISLTFFILTHFGAALWVGFRSDGGVMHSFWTSVSDWPRSMARVLVTMIVILIFITVLMISDGVNPFVRHTIIVLNRKGRPVKEYAYSDWIGFSEYFATFEYLSTLFQQDKCEFSSEETEQCVEDNE